MVDLIRNNSRTPGDHPPVNPTVGAAGKTAADLSCQIDAFLDLSDRLRLTLTEEETLLSMDPHEWALWRNRSVDPVAPAPPLLIRRLDYALSLLARMITAAAEAPQSTAGSEPRS